MSTSSPAASPLGPRTPEHQLSATSPGVPNAPGRKLVGPFLLTPAGLKPTRLHFEDESQETPDRVLQSPMPPAKPTRRRTKTTVSTGYGPRRLSFSGEPESPTSALEATINQSGSVLDGVPCKRGLQRLNRRARAAYRRSFVLKALASKASRPPMPIKVPEEVGDSDSSTEYEGGDDDSVVDAMEAASNMHVQDLDLMHGASPLSMVAPPATLQSILCVRSNTMVAPDDPKMSALNERLDRLEALYKATSALLSPTRAHAFHTVTTLFLKAMGVSVQELSAVPDRFSAVCQSMFGTLRQIGDWVCVHRANVAVFEESSAITQAPAVQEPEAASVVAGFLLHLRPLPGVQVQGLSNDKTDKAHMDRLMDQRLWLAFVLESCGLGMAQIDTFKADAEHQQLYNDIFTLLFGRWHRLCEHTSSFLALACLLEQVIFGDSVIKEMRFAVDIKESYPFNKHIRPAHIAETDTLVPMDVNVMHELQWWEKVYYGCHRVQDRFFA